MYVNYRYLCTWYVVNLIYYWLSRYETFLEKLSSTVSLVSIANFPPSWSLIREKGECPRGTQLSWALSCCSRQWLNCSDWLGSIGLFDAKMAFVAYYADGPNYRARKRYPTPAAIVSHEVTLPAAPSQRDGRSSRFTLTNRPLKSGIYRDSIAWLSRRKCPN